MSKIDAPPPQTTIETIPQVNDDGASTTTAATTTLFWKNAVVNPFITKMLKIFDNTDVHDLTLYSNDDSKDDSTT